MRIVFQHLNPALDQLSEEEQAILDAADVLVEHRPATVPFFVTSVETSPFVAELSRRGWEFEIVAENATYTSTAEIDALVSRTWSRAKKQFEFDRAKADAFTGTKTVTDDSGAQAELISPSALKAAKRKAEDIESSREYRIGKALLRPLRVIRGNRNQTKAKS
jgi:hypothetical protein